MAEIDLGNVMGPQGEDGSQWYWGTAITGTSTSGAVFSSSGITNARVNDKYYNTSTSNIYTCTTEGAESVARWAYIGNIKGEQGNIGPAGPTGSVDFTTPITFSIAGTRSDLASGDSIATLFGKTQKWFADINSGGASTLLATNLSANRALISNANGKVAVSSVTSTELGYLDGVTSAIQTQLNTINTSIGTLSDLTTTAKSSLVAAANELNGNKQNALWMPIARMSASADWNAAKQPGWYTMPANTANGPASGVITTGLVLCHDGNVSYPIQIVFAFNSFDIWIRVTDASGAWQSWRSIKYAT